MLQDDYIKKCFQDASKGKKTRNDVTRILENIDKETQKSRILARNGARAERFFAEWIPREEAYFETEQIRRRAKLSFFLQD